MTGLVLLVVQVKISLKRLRSKLERLEKREMYFMGVLCGAHGGAKKWERSPRSPWKTTTPARCVPRVA